jgi:imidazoleglycerol-phosphate dehydratase
MRTGQITRNTTETDISLQLDLDGRGQSKIDSGVPFLDHMLTLFAAHGKFNLNIECKGDISVDDHHTVEDIGICLGRAFSDALGERRGITRFAETVLPMDEALILTAVDISGRSSLHGDLSIPSPKVGAFDTELVWEFLNSFVREAKITLHVRQLAGSNSHHIIEACFKSLARSLGKAVKIAAQDSDSIPSTKGVLK